MTVRVAVIGGGVIGMSAAMHAAALGARVTVLERDYPASGSSSLSLGVFNRQTPDLLELELRIRSIALLEELARDGLPLDRHGYLRLARRPEQLDRFRETVAAQCALGYTGGRVLDRDELQALMPSLRCDDLSGALYGGDDGGFDGHLVCAAYQERAEALGVRVRVRSPVTAVERGGDAIVLVTPQDRIECDRVINAGGAWAMRIGEILGTPCPLVVQRHQITKAKLRVPLPGIPPVVNEYVPGSGDFALVMRPESADRLLVMLHSHEAVEGHDAADPDDYARAVSFDYLEQVAERLAHRLPGLADDLSLEAGWAGLYPISPDGRFIVGPYASDPRVVAAAGVGGVGITVSGAVGRLAADWAVRGQTAAFSFADELLPGRPSLRAADAMAENAGGAR
jgi:sarcosine oxidase subunit beta